MAIQENERQEIITRIKEYGSAIQELCAAAFALGHEEGWWLSRTDPDSTVSPVHHERQVNPFIEMEPQPKVEPATEGEFDDSLTRE